MELTQLEYFLKVAQIEHLTKAAEALSVTQPALSHSISKLETELGVALFERKGRNLQINRYGTMFMKRVEKIMQEVERGKQEIQECSNPESGIIYQEGTGNLNLLFKTSSPNHEISVYDTTELYGEKGRFRVLEFSNSAIQGAMDLNDPIRILFEYPRAIIHVINYNIPDFENAFIIGHGIGTIAGYFTEKRCKVAELDQTVVELSKRFFGYNRDNVSIGDGRQILANEERDAYDAIVLDAFTEKGTPTHLISKPFFEMCRDKLDSSGLIIMNLFGKGENDQLVNAIHSTLSEEFAYIKAFSLPSEGVADIQNIILVGRNKPIGFQARHMAGFIEIELEQGYVIRDKVVK